MSPIRTKRAAKRVTCERIATGSCVFDVEARNPALRVTRLAGEALTVPGAAAPDAARGAFVIKLNLARAGNDVGASGEGVARIVRQIRCTRSACREEAAGADVQRSTIRGISRGAEFRGCGQSECCARFVVSKSSEWVGGVREVFNQSFCSGQGDAGVVGDDVGAREFERAGDVVGAARQCVCAAIEVGQTVGRVHDEFAAGAYVQRSIVGETAGGGECDADDAPDGSGSFPSGKALKAQDLRSELIQKKTDDELAAAITNGKGKMPAFGKKLKPDQIAQLVAYIRALPKK